MNKIKIFFLITFTFFMSIQAQNQPNLYKKVDLIKMNQWVDSIFNQMTFDEKIGQLFMIVADPGTGEVNTKKNIRHINEQKIGGMLFSKGMLSNQATSTNAYQKASKIPLLISFDGEWGLAMRLENTPSFPKNITLGAIQDNRLLHEYGKEVGRQCRELGVQINFAPVLDVNTNPDNPVIGYRSFGENPLMVAEKGIAYSAGLESRGVISVAKHFPGHGDTSEDSHETLPIVNKSLEQIKNEDLLPFKYYIDLGFAGVMSGHLSVPALDNVTGKPTSLSPKIITDLLQKEMNFSGLAFTDALVMKGASAETESVCVDALLAGNDVLLSPGNPIAEFNAVKRAVQRGIIDTKLIDEKCRKILSYKYIAGLNEYKPIDLNGLSGRINSEYARWLIGKLSDEAITLLKNDSAAVPVKNLENKKIAVLSIGEADRTEFQKMLSNYKQVDFFNIPRNATDAAVDKVFRSLSKYDLIICGIHYYKMPDYPQLQKLSKEKDVFLSFFVTPYYMSRFRPSITNAKAVICGYENIPETQKSTAQVIMGGIPAKGKLPVTIAGLFRVGEGFETSKTRLAYQYPREVNLSERKLSRIDAIVQEGIKNQAFPGCQVLIAKNGAIVYNKSFGYFDFAKTHAVKNSDVYDLASVTKAAATLPAVMKVYDEKKLKLTDYLSTYIPQLKVDEKEQITVKQALFHESGFASFLPFYKLAIDTATLNTAPLYSTKRDATYRIQYDDKTFVRTDFEYDKKWVSQTPKQGYSLQVGKRFYLKNDFPDEIIKEIAKSKLKRPGSYTYSDLNFMLLKEIVEKISKEPINKFLETNFYAPLGADLLGYKPLQKIDTLNIAPTEDDRFLRNQILIGFPHDEAAAFMGGVSGNAGLFSNANDLAKLLQLLLNQGVYGDKRYLSSETCKLFMETKSSVSRRGLGFDKPDMENEKINPTGKSAPASTIGHTGFTGTCFWIDPDNQLIYIFLSNRVYPSRTNKELMKMGIRSRIQDVIY
ncbi:MAG: serine hydrolase [Dysgonamonadaceae bacterium]|nr:serine hydrolase [Dysgonamonadaceae bacterium]